MRILILAILVWCSLLSRAEAQSPILLQAKAAFERYAPNSHFHEHSTVFGDINGDGITDFVTFIIDSNHNDHDVENMKIAVFLGAKGNSFSLYEVSSGIGSYENDSPHPSSSYLEIKRQSIFLDQEGSAGCCSIWFEKLQFKLHDGQLMLIGSETANYHPQGSTEPDTGVSANFITGRVIRWSSSGKNRREKKTSISALKPVPFKDFDYDNFTAKWSNVLW